MTAVSSTLSERSARKRRLRYGIKLCAGLAVAAWLIARGDERRVLLALSGVSPGWFGLGLLIYLAGQSLCAWKWGLLAGSLGIRQPPRFYWVTYFGGMFASLLLPALVGGDVFRMAALAERGEDRSAAAVSVLADRGTGLLALVWIALAASLGLPAGVVPAPLALGTCVAAGVLTLGFVVPFFLPVPSRAAFVRRALECWARPAPLLLSLGAAFVFQALAVGVYYCLGRALSLPVDPRFYFLLGPAVSLVSMIPVTVNGIGLREAALVALFPLAGIEAERALALGVTWTAMSVLASLAGGLVLASAGERAGCFSGEVGRRGHQFG